MRCSLVATRRAKSQTRWPPSCVSTKLFFLSRSRLTRALTGRFQPLQCPRQREAIRLLCASGHASDAQPDGAAQSLSLPCRSLSRVLLERGSSVFCCAGLSLTRSWLARSSPRWVKRWPRSRAPLPHKKRATPAWREVRRVKSARSPLPPHHVPTELKALATTQTTAEMQAETRKLEAASAELEERLKTLRDPSVKGNQNCTHFCPTSSRL